MSWDEFDDVKERAKRSRAYVRHLATEAAVHGCKSVGEAQEYVNENFPALDEDDEYMMKEAFAVSFAFAKLAHHEKKKAAPSSQSTSSVTDQQVRDAYRGQNLLLNDDGSTFDASSYREISDEESEESVQENAPEPPKKRLTKKEKSTKLVKCRCCEMNLQQAYYSNNQWTKPAPRCSDCIDGRHATACKKNKGY